MARILIVFGTTEGHTAKVAGFLGDELRARGHLVTVADAAGTIPNPAHFDAALIAGSVHAGAYQRALVHWVLAHADTLNTMPTGFVSVCLAVLQHQEAADRGLQAVIDAFLQSTSWQPQESKIVAGALKYTRYNILKRWLMKQLVKNAGGDTDTSRDYEYTDWEDLRRFAGDFSRRASSHASPKSA